MGSRAIAVSPDGKNVYVASSKSNAIAIFGRNAETGALIQPRGRRLRRRQRGRRLRQGDRARRPQLGRGQPQRPHRLRDLAHQQLDHRFRRNAKTGALRQLPPAAGCISGLPIPGCAAGRALLGPDVVVVSPDAENVYVGSFFGNAVAVFAAPRKPAP